MNKHNQFFTLVSLVAFSFVLISSNIFSCEKYKILKRELNSQYLQIKLDNTRDDLKSDLYNYIDIGKARESIIAKSELKALQIGAVDGWQNAVRIVIKALELEKRARIQAESDLIDLRRKFDVFEATTRSNAKRRDQQERSVKAEYEALHSEFAHAQERITDLSNSIFESARKKALAVVEQHEDLAQDFKRREKQKERYLNRVEVLARQAAKESEKAAEEYMSVRTQLSPLRHQVMQLATDASELSSLRRELEEKTLKIRAKDAEIMNLREALGLSTPAF